MSPVPRDWEGFVSPRPRCGYLWRRTPDKELPCQHFTGSEEHPLAPAGGAHWVPAAEQPHRVLVHGGLCPAWLPGLAAGIQQHVWAAHPERAVHWQHPPGRAADALPQPRPAQPARGLCAAVSPRGFSGVWSMQTAPAAQVTWLVCWVYAVQLNLAALQNHGSV